MKFRFVSRARAVVCAFFFAAFFAVVGLLPCAGAQGPPAQMTVYTRDIVAPVSPSLYGLMTEEINHSYDGGLYAEMVNNRTFRGNWMGTEGWGLVELGRGLASATLDKADGPSEALPTSLKLTVTGVSAGNEAGLSNPGFWGMAVRPATVYKGSFYARTDAAGPLTVRLVEDATGAVLASATVALQPGGWKRYAYSMSTGAKVKVSASNHLELLLQRPGTVKLQLVSLMPPTFHDRPNGNRADLMERMAAMHPHFLRLPGGNYLEGDTMADWYDFKKTIGPLVDRPGHQAPWTYWSTDGMGLLEFLEWCEDLKIEPVLAVYAGYALKHDYAKPGPALEPYVQAALDEVEYVTGAVTTKWGAERARDGHAAPFPLRYIEIGNEDWFDRSGSYDARFAQFALALRKRYPQYKLIATTPVKEDPGAEPDVLDDHYYRSPAEMFALVHRYDDASRTGPKIFVGEWATRSGSPTPNFGDALGDAAWMTGLERNADLIVMASYAPLLVNVNPGAMQWATDLIGFDALTTYGSPSYYAQCMFAAHVGDGRPRMEMSGAAERFFSSATVSSADHVLHLKLVNASQLPQPLALELNGLRGVDARELHVARSISLHGGTFLATNSMTAPEAIVPVESTVKFAGTKLEHTVPPLTIEVLDVPLE